MLLTVNRQTHRQTHRHTDSSQAGQVLSLNISMNHIKNVSIKPRFQKKISEGLCPRKEFQMAGAE